MSQEFRSKRVNPLPRRGARATAAALIAALAAAGSLAPAGEPVSIKLVGSDGDTASLLHRTERYRMTDVDGQGPPVASIATDLLLEFTPTIIGGGRVAVSFHLAVTSGEDRADRRVRFRNRCALPRSFEMNEAFEVNDGETIALEPLFAGQPVIVTTKILEPDLEPASMVFIEARLPAGAACFRRGDMRKTQVAKLVSLPDRPAVVEESTLQYFAARPKTAVPIEGGSSLEFTASVTGETVGLAVGVHSRSVGRGAPPASGPLGWLSLRLPPVRTLNLQTRLDVPSGDTIVVGGIETVFANEFVFLTPEIIDFDGSDLVLLESRVITAGGDEPEVEGEPARSELFQGIDLAMSIESAAAVSQMTEHGFVTAFADGEPVPSLLEIGTRMQVTPVGLVADDFGFDLDLSNVRLDGPVVRVPAGIFGAAGHFELVSQRDLRVDTRLVLGDGQTVLAAGIDEEVVRTNLHTRRELLVLATQRLGDVGAPAEVTVEARIVGTTERRGPDTSETDSTGGLVERLECGPVETGAPGEN